MVRRNQRDGARASKRKRARCAALLAAIALLAPAAARAQASYAGHQDARTVWAGGECSVFSSSFPYQGGNGGGGGSPVPVDRPAADSMLIKARPATSFPGAGEQGIFGCGAFANVRLTYHFDVEGDVRWLAFGGYQGTTERSMLIGPRYIVRRFGRFEPYGKFLFGQGHIDYPYKVGPASYFALVPGGGVNYRFSRRLTLRAEYEYQFWRNSPGLGIQPQHPLHPNGINVGIAYRLFYF